MKWVIEIKVRAERKCGEMLKQSAKSGERTTRQAASPKGRAGNQVVQCDLNKQQTLSDMGISKDQSSRWQKLADIPEEHFETAVETAKEHAGTMPALGLALGVFPAS